MDDVLKNLAVALISKLDEIENGTDFDLLLSVKDCGVRDDAILLREEINKLKAHLKSI